MQNRPPTALELTQLCESWQKVLGLDAWRVKVKLCRARDFNVEGRQGEIIFDRKRLEADIKIIDPQDYPPGELFPQDIEQTLVHELLHLVWAVTQVDAGTEEYVQWEAAIHLTARAMMTLRREIRDDG